MNKNSKIYVAGHRGLVGSAIVRNLQERGYTNIIGRTHKELDLTRQSDVEKFFEEEKPEYVFLAAARVGGIYINNEKPADFIYENLMIESNVIHSSYKNNVKKLLFLGTGCIYPKFAEQPIKEEYLLTGELESTNEAYAIAKISGIELCKFYRRQYGCNYISAMPANLYGINDNFDLETSHVLPAIIRKVHEAKINGDKDITIWGTGKALREFMYVDDLADALVHLMLNYSEEIHVNMGTGEEYSIKELTEIVKEVVGFKGEIKNDLSKPDGTPRKLLDVSRLEATGWKYKTSLKEGITKVYNWYVENNK
ncbi:GDP-L-fucose synthase [Fusobacterium varium]|uniref:GDP-L-fucose synthase n=1 Tax=Fusobacterium varium TaxID=856 RepID=UPI000E41D6BD|nr:GDP-L-fucose synthase [Fusobacterium varium]MDY4005708.1 GDP-L-fucose synthase [Fusobacterium varium]RGJ28024.1 GDP-L-fucose synthase [Fusobacterium varium]